MQKAINLKALHYYLSYRHVPTPLSIMRGRRAAPRLKVRCPVFNPPLTLSEDEIVDRMDQMLQGVIQNMMASGIPPCVLLSGGIDSGLAAAMISKVSPRVRTFCLVYDGKEGRDEDYARWISGIYGTDHTELRVSFNQFPEVLPQVMRGLGEPFSGYITPWLIADRLLDYTPVIITGDMADELFGSYRAHRLAYEMPDVPAWELRYRTVVFRDDEKRPLYSKEVRERTKLFSTKEHLKEYGHTELTAPDALNRMLQAEFRSFYPDHTLLPLQALINFGISTLSPYYSHDFADMASQIPGELKMKGGEPKYILKRLAERYLPEEIVHRPKQGFVTPTMPLCLALEKWIRGALEPKRLTEHGLFNPDCVQQLVDSFYLSPDEGAAYKLWSLVSFEVWYASCFASV